MAKKKENTKKNKKEKTINFQQFIDGVRKTYKAKIRKDADKYFKSLKK